MKIKNIIITIMLMIFICGCGSNHYAKITGKDYTIPKKPGTQVIYLDNKED